MSVAVSAAFGEIVSARKKNMVAYTARKPVGSGGAAGSSEPNSKKQRVDGAALCEHGLGLAQQILTFATVDALSQVSPDQYDKPLLIIKVAVEEGFNAFFGMKT